MHVELFRDGIITAGYFHDSVRDRERKHLGQNVNVNDWSDLLYKSYLYNPCNFSVSLKLLKENVLKITYLIRSL